ncbi:hypothetical protein MTR67_007183 [Solanum verrucosum]|uniref:Integrase zinc-binding domain-containing protein n=1 Tax=Solanum verrucosum TaxID=315347 RepID=A0AAF0PZA7_SOLVR|nr:hypothetical protein MTR67_007183 [Solanum verrucosum]
MVHIGSESSFVADVKANQGLDPTLVEFKRVVLKKSIKSFSQGEYSVLRYQGRLCVPNVDDLREQILTEAHSSQYSIRSGATKMYFDLWEVYWWSGMIKDIAKFMAKCPNCQQVKIEHQKSGERLKTAQSQQKSYVDVRRRDLEFDVNNKVYLKISPMKDVMRFGKKWKLSPRYVAPYQIFRRISKVAYELNLPNEVALVYPVFHVFLLKKCVGDLTSLVTSEGLGVKENLSYEEVLVEILEVKKLRNKEIASVKVL